MKQRCEEKFCDKKAVTFQNGKNVCIRHECRCYMKGVFSGKNIFDGCVVHGNK